MPDTTAPRVRTKEHFLVLEEAQSSTGGRGLAWREAVALGGTESGVMGRGLHQPRHEEEGEGSHTQSCESEVEEEKADEAFQWQHMSASSGHILRKRAWAVGVS